MKHRVDDKASIVESVDPTANKPKVGVTVEIQEAEKYIQDEKSYTPEEYAKLKRKIDW